MRDLSAILRWPYTPLYSNRELLPQQEFENTNNSMVKSLTAFSCENIVRSCQMQ